MCTFKLSMAKRLPYGRSEYTRSSARHSLCTAGFSDVSSSTMDCLANGHSIKIFRFSAEREREQTDAQRRISEDVTSMPCKQLLLEIVCIRVWLNADCALNHLFTFALALFMCVCSTWRPSHCENNDVNKHFTISATRHLPQFQHRHTQFLAVCIFCFWQEASVKRRW